MHFRLVLGKHARQTAASNIILKDSDEMFFHHQEANGDYTRYEHIISWLRYGVFNSSWAS